MGMTIAEKIIARAAGVDTVKAGEIHTVEVDQLLSNDGTTHLTIDMYNNQLKHPRMADVNKLVWVVDHNVPADSPRTAASQKKMRDFAKEHGITFYEGQGVCHQIMMENHVRPGELIFGADSHTCAYGALGAFGTGVGCTDYLYAMVTGKSWVLVPETLRFHLTGRLPEGVYARDLILTIIGKIGANGANYKAMEFTGEGLKTLNMSDRISVCNLCVEAGAKTALMEVDEIALDYLHAHGREPKACFTSDADAVFAASYDIDLSTVTPIVAKPHFGRRSSRHPHRRGISWLLQQRTDRRPAGGRRNHQRKKGPSSGPFPCGTGKPGCLLPGAEGRAPSDLHGSRCHRHESQLQRLLGKLPGSHRRRRNPDQYRNQEFQGPRRAQGFLCLSGKRGDRDGFRRQRRDRHSGYGIMPQYYIADGIRKRKQVSYE